jgi:hypothetical protein
MPASHVLVALTRIALVNLLPIAIVTRVVEVHPEGVGQAGQDGTTVPHFEAKCQEGISSMSQQVS